MHAGFPILPRHAARAQVLAVRGTLCERNLQANLHMQNAHPFPTYTGACHSDRVASEHKRHVSQSSTNKASTSIFRGNRIHRRLATYAHSVDMIMSCSCFRRTQLITDRTYVNPTLWQCDAARPERALLP